MTDGGSFESGTAEERKNMGIWFFNEMQMRFSLTVMPVRMTTATGRYHLKPIVCTGKTESLIIINGLRYSIKKLNDTGKIIFSLHKQVIFENVGR